MPIFSQILAEIILVSFISTSLDKCIISKPIVSVEYGTQSTLCFYAEPQIVFSVQSAVKDLHRSLHCCRLKGFRPTGSGPSFTCNGSEIDLGQKLF